MSRGDELRDLIKILLFFVVVAGFALSTQSGVALNFMLMALYGALLAQSWNMLGGFGGLFSFGHALFFGTGAYLQAVLQLSYGFGAWPALVLAILGAGCLGGIVGAICFRYGLKGSYFALVTLAFAEIFRILATSVSITGGGVGLMLPLSQSSMLGERFEAINGFVLLMLVFVTMALLVTAWFRHSRFGAYLQAVRDNEAAARAIGVRPFQVKFYAMVLSAAFMGSAGALYMQIFRYLDPSIAYGPLVSVEALVGAIVGGIGTVWGPVLGALVLHVLADITRNLFGEIPGINLVIYGVILVAIVIMMPRGCAGLGNAVRRMRGRARRVQA